MFKISYTSLPPFDQYFEPKTVEETVSLLKRYGNNARLLAGGTDLINLQRKRVVNPKCIINIMKVSGLDYIRFENNMLSIGALATLRMVEFSSVIRQEFPVFFESVHQIGTVQVRNMGTVVGNICRASPAADTAPPLLMLESQVEITSAEGFRMVPLERFFQGPGETVLKPSEMVTQILIKKPPPFSGTAFLRLSRSAVDLAKVSVASLVTIDKGVWKKARIAIGGVAPTPIRARNVEIILEGKRIDKHTVNEACQAIVVNPITDVRSTESYRREMAKILARNAIDIATERAADKMI